MKRKYKEGDILRSKVNGAEVKIVKIENGHYSYRDLKSGKVFTMGCENLERCLVEKVN